MIVLSFNSIDDLFNSIDKGKLLLEDMHSLVSAAEVDEALFTVYKESQFDNVPQCNCGKFKVAYMENEECDECGSKIESVINKNYPMVWLRRYENAEQFISPYFWMVLRNILSSKLDVLRWLSDSNYNPPVIMPPWLKRFTAQYDYKRGYNNLVQHMDKLLHFTANSSEFRNARKYEELAILLNIWNDNRNIVLSEYMGMFNKRLFVIEETKMGHFTSLILGEVKDICYNYILNNNDLATPRKKESVMSKVIHGMADIIEQYIRDNLQGKPGDFRKHFSGARMPFSFRAVIRSMDTKGSRDELHVPWTIGVTTFRMHIMNLLVKRFDYTVQQASDLLFAHTKRFHPDIEKCFNILMSESPFGGLVCFFTRNPSLPMGSTQMKIITRVKSDIHDNTISMSNLTVRPYNADWTYTIHCNTRNNNELKAS